MSRDKDNPVDPDISKLYQSTRTEGPGAALDAAILAEAEAAVTPQRRRPAWLAPVGLAATVLLGVNLAINLKDYSNDPDVFSDATAPVVQSSDAPDAARKSATAMSPERVTTDAGRESSEAPRAAGDAQDTARAGDERVVSVPGRAISPELQDYAPAPAPRPIAASAAGNDAGSDASRSPDRLAARSAPASASVAPDPAPMPERSASHAQAPVARQAAKAANTVETESDSTTPVVSDVRPRQVITTDPRGTAAAGTEPSTLVVETVPDADGAAMRVRPDQPPKSAPLDAAPEEIVVTGSAVSRHDDGPHERPGTREMVRKNAVQATVSASAESETAALQAEAAPVYTCDLDALRIDQKTIASVKVDARTAEPPLTAVTWPDFIRQTANDGDYVLACAHLAAYRDLFPDAVLIDPLPVTLAPDP